MELFAIILLGVSTISGAIVLWMELSITNDRLQWLEERLTKLEKDAVKITFSEPPFSPQDEKTIVHPKVTRVPERKKDVVLGEWQTKNKTKPLIEGRVKSTSKGDTGTTQAPPPLPARKPKNWNK
jgi:hypothetical protein